MDCAEYDVVINDASFASKLPLVSISGFSFRHYSACKKDKIFGLCVKNGFGCRYAVLEAFVQIPFRGMKR